MTYDFVIIGGGASGIFAAIIAARNGKRVLVLERNATLMKKLSITGKGRCNLTNHSDNDTIMRNIHRNSRFMYSALSVFGSEDVMRFFEELGIPLKTERGNRVFPQSDKAADIVTALQNEAERLGVIIKTARVTKVTKNDDIFEITAGEVLHSHKLLIATGGVSYPKTGSSGDGYRFAKHFGHTIVSPKPSLVPLVTAESCEEIMGLSLRNVKLSLYDKQAKKASKPLFFDQGEMLFTHFGVSGPLVLSASSYIEAEESERYIISIDLKPALSNETLDKRILRDFAEAQNKQLVNALGKLLPQKLIAFVIARAKLDSTKQVNLITKEERQRLLTTIKSLDFTFESFLSLDTAVITDGGISVKEVDPKTMQSKLVTNLYFSGEILDVTGFTGGFNLQIAFSTAYLAAMNI